MDTIRCAIIMFFGFSRTTGSEAIRAQVKVMPGKRSFPRWVQEAEWPPSRATRDKSRLNLSINHSTSVPLFSHNTLASSGFVGAIDSARATPRYHRFPTCIHQLLSNCCSHNPSPLESSNNNKMCMCLCDVHVAVAVAVDVAVVVVVCVCCYCACGGCCCGHGQCCHCLVCVLWLLCVQCGVHM